MVGGLADLAGPLALAALGVSVLAFIVALAVLRRGKPAELAPEPGMVPADASELQGALAVQARRIEALVAELATLHDQAGAVTTMSRRAVQRVGLVRFNPFEDTGSNQSFALALLDADANGFVLSSLHSRQATRIYLKGVTGGRADAALSAEEAEAPRQAGATLAPGTPTAAARPTAPGS